MMVFTYMHCQSILKCSCPIKQGVHIARSTWLYSIIAKPMVHDDRKLPDDRGEVPKSEWRDWWFDSWLWNLLSTWLEKQEPTHCKIGNIRHPAPRGSLSKVGPTGSFHVRLPDVVYNNCKTNTLKWMYLSWDYPRAIPTWDFQHKSTSFF